ncbi:MAG: thermonuclease family protein [Halothiobacillaceae bacterium]|nr:MAG: thermonuclease family protein [Halothiobacillaceae bacterium]
MKDSPSRKWAFRIMATLGAAILVSAIGAVIMPNGQSRVVQGVVVGVIDGDTLILRVDDRERVCIRLAGLDAPEKRQDFWEAAKRSLSDLVFRRPVRVAVVDVDASGRFVGKVYTADLFVNAEQVGRGMAWGRGRYSRDERLVARQAEARQQGKGLWAAADPVPPWEFRDH